MSATTAPTSLTELRTPAEIRRARIIGIIYLVLAAFVLFYLFTRPEAAAEAVKSFFGAFEAIGRFFTSLAS